MDIFSHAKQNNVMHKNNTYRSVIVQGRRSNLYRDLVVRRAGLIYLVSRYRKLYGCEIATVYLHKIDGSRPENEFPPLHLLAGNHLENILERALKNKPKIGPTLSMQ